MMGALTSDPGFSAGAARTSFVTLARILATVH